MKAKLNLTSTGINPKETFRQFEQITTGKVKRGEAINPSKFSSQLFNLGSAFEKQGSKEVMNKNSKRLAETLVGMKEFNLSGIIYSFLIKFNPNNPKLRETLATNALALAKRLQDPVHIAARANDLKDLSESNPNKYIKFLYETKRALVSVVEHYENAKKKFRTVNREIKPRECYQETLCKIKLLIAQYIMNKHPIKALEELNTAESLVPDKHSLQTKIQNLICTLESKLLENNVGKNRRR